VAYKLRGYNMIPPSFSSMVFSSVSLSFSCPWISCSSNSINLLVSMLSTYRLVKSCVYLFFNCYISYEFFILRVSSYSFFKLWDVWTLFPNYTLISYLCACKTLSISSMWRFSAVIDTFSNSVVRSSLCAFNTPSS